MKIDKCSRKTENHKLTSIIKYRQLFLKQVEFNKKKTLFVCCIKTDDTFILIIVDFIFN